MPYIKRKDKGKYRGQAFAPGKILLVEKDLFNRLILDGKGVPSTEDDYKKQILEEKNKIKKLVADKKKAAASLSKKEEDEK